MYNNYPQKSHVYQTYTSNSYYDLKKEWRILHLNIDTSLFNKKTSKKKRLVKFIRVFLAS